MQLHRGTNDLPITPEEYDHFLDQLFANIPESWDDDVAAESILIDYVRRLETIADNAAFSREKYAEARPC